MSNDTLPREQNKKMNKKRKAGKKSRNQEQHQPNGTESEADTGITGGNNEGDTPMEEVSNTTQRKEDGIRESNTPCRKRDKPWESNVPYRRAG
jgi:hypothetical protein